MQIQRANDAFKPTDKEERQRAGATAVLVDVSVVSPICDHLDNKETDRAADIKLD